MIIKFPENENAATRDNRLISFIDFAPPTVLSLAGIEPPKVMQGVAQFGEFEVEEKPEFTYHTSDRFDEVYDRLRAVRSADYKYIKSFNTELSHALPVTYREQMPLMRNLRRLYAAGKLNEIQAAWLHPHKPEEELYDLNDDPYELNNLADDPDYQEVLTQYRQLLMSWMSDSNDLGRVDERSLIERWLVKGEQPRLDPLQLKISEFGIELIDPKGDARWFIKPPRKMMLGRFIQNPPFRNHSSLLPKRNVLVM